jgi:ABC-type nickel/cobalt efflux system permease component RcnA
MLAQPAFAPELLLIAAVIGVGVLHTIVPDHWVPIALIARQQGWSRGETARAALQAGTGHVVSTLLLGVAVWGAGMAFAAEFGRYVSLASSLALVAFGLWIAAASWRELRAHERAEPVAPPVGVSDAQTAAAAVDAAISIAANERNAADELYLPLRGGIATHLHPHRHGTIVHTHRHDHDRATVHVLDPHVAQEPPLHAHGHRRSRRTALLLILGSSPMIEGLPAFFAAGRYGVALEATMAVCFGAATIATYVALCVSSTVGLQRVELGRFEKYGEVASGAFIAAVGIVFFFLPLS